ncbi:hypothetical protein FRB97_009389 [Tulasnella sp. 331]|nr:hypothetical protein FRB97_009389 [Tulasnella sp. 331]
MFTLRWGILGAGHISSCFVKASDPWVAIGRRDVHDVQHKVTAVGSRDINKAQKFVNEFVTSEAKGEAKAYGSYKEVVKAKDVDAVYIGKWAQLIQATRTPHTHHYDCAVLAFKGGKHVLLEKPATVNAAELRSLMALAKEKNLFFMEAMWTRFLPITKAIKEVITSGELGELKVLHADLSGDFDLETLYEDPRNGTARPSAVSGSMVKTKSTGVDSSTAFVLDFQHLEAQVMRPTFASQWTPLMIIMLDARLFYPAASRSLNLLKEL